MYNGGGIKTTVVVSIIIEDHPLKTIYINNGSDPGIRITPSDSLSYVPLQFLVDGKYSKKSFQSQTIFDKSSKDDNNKISVDVWKYVQTARQLKICSTTFTNKPLCFLRLTIKVQEK